jgi:hypothetical protein
VLFVIVPSVILAPAVSPSYIIKDAQAGVTVKVGVIVNVGVGVKPDGQACMKVLNIASISGWPCQGI